MKNYKLTFENNRTCTIECEETGQPLQDKINAAEQRFNSPVVKINDKEVKEHSLGGFLLGAVIGSVLGNSVAKSGVKKTASKIGSRTKKAVGNAKKDISEFRKASSKKFSNGGKTDKYGFHIEPQFKEGDLVTYNGFDGEIIKVGKDSRGKYYYDVLYAKQGLRVVANYIYNKGNEIKLKNKKYNNGGGVDNEIIMTDIYATKNGKKVKVNSQPMELKYAENWIKEQGIDKYYTDIDFKFISEKYNNGGGVDEEYPNKKVLRSKTAPDGRLIEVISFQPIKDKPNQLTYGVLENGNYRGGYDNQYYANSAAYSVLNKIIQESDDPYYENGGIIKFGDGFSFKKVSKEYAEKNFQNENIFGINVSQETESLIESKEDLDDFEVFGIEMGFKDTFAHGGQIPDIIETLVLEENQNVSDTKKMKRKVYDNIFSFLPEIEINEIGDISNRYGKNNQEFQQAIREFISKTPYETKRNYYDSLNPGDILIYDNLGSYRSGKIILVSVGTNPEFVYGWSKFFPGWIQVDINKIFVPEYAQEMGFTLSNLREKPKGTDFEGNYLYSDGGLVGKHAIFDRFGEQKMGIITEDLGDGRLIVISGMGQYAVTPDNLISITEPVEKKGFFSFGKGGSVYNRSWHQDHNRHNKAESYEKPMSERSKKFALGGSLSKGDIYEGREVFSEIGSYNSEADARAVVEENNKFFTENDQPLVADVVSYSKKMGDRDVKIIKAVVFLKKKFAGGGGVKILYSGSELNRRFELSKQEILADVKSGKVPKSVNSFSDLQNYVDANCYGGLCDNDYKISQDYSFENKLQVKLNHWIEQGGIKGSSKYADGGKITKQPDGTYTHPSGYVIEPAYDKGRYILLDPDGMDAVGESMTLKEAKETLLDNVENYEFGNGGYLVQYGPGNKQTIISTKSEADDFVKTLKEKGHTNIKVRSKSEYKKQYESTSKDIKMDLQKRFNINPNSYALILSEKGKWKISPVNIKDWMNNYGSIQTVEQEINKQYKKFSKGGGVGNITEKELLDWAKGIDDENLLSWCGYSNKGDFEDSADLPYSKKNLVETNFEDLEYVYNNQNEYGIKYNNGGGVEVMGVDFEKVKKADEIYREHNKERISKGIENFSEESVELWNKKYDDRLNKLNLTYQEKSQLNPKNWYANGGGIPSVKKYRLLSPDGFDIEMDALYSEEELMPAFEQFKKRYEKQGYYSTANRERIDLRDLEDYMSVVEVENYEDYE